MYDESKIMKIVMLIVTIHHSSSFINIKIIISIIKVNIQFAIVFNGKQLWIKLQIGETLILLGEFKSCLIKKTKCKTNNVKYT